MKFTARPAGSRLVVGIAAVLALLAGVLVLVPRAARRHRATPPAGQARRPKPTIVLVHGAFADSSGWNAVAGRLLKDGYTVLAFSNPLRGPPPTPSTCVSSSPRSRARRPRRPLLRRRGHHQRRHRKPQREVARLRRRVRAGQGESVARPTSSAAATPRSPTTSSCGPYPGAPAGDADAYIDPAYFHRAVRPGPATLDHRRHGRDPASRCPRCAGDALRRAGLEDDPELVPGRQQDRIIPPEAERAMAARAEATTVRSTAHTSR